MWLKTYLKQQWHFLHLLWLTDLQHHHTVPGSRKQLKRNRWEQRTESAWYFPGALLLSLSFFPGPSCALDRYTAPRIWMSTMSHEVQKLSIYLCPALINNRAASFKHTWKPCFRRKHIIIKSAPISFPMCTLFSLIACLQPQILPSSSSLLPSKYLSQVFKKNH